MWLPSHFEDSAFHTIVIHVFMLLVGHKVVHIIPFENEDSTHCTGEGLVNYTIMFSFPFMRDDSTTRSQFSLQLGS
jgi:hypothetical protein